MAIERNDVDIVKILAANRNIDINALYILTHLFFIKFLFIFNIILK